MRIRLNTKTVEYINIWAYDVAVRIGVGVVRRACVFSVSSGKTKYNGNAGRPFSEEEERRKKINKYAVWKHYTFTRAPLCCAFTPYEHTRVRLTYGRRITSVFKSGFVLFTPCALHRRVVARRCSTEQEENIKFQSVPFIMHIYVQYLLCALVIVVVE